MNNKRWYSGSTVDVLQIIPRKKWGRQWNKKVCSINI